MSKQKIIMENEFRSVELEIYEDNVVELYIDCKETDMAVATFFDLKKESDRLAAETLVALLQEELEKTK